MVTSTPGPRDDTDGTGRRAARLRPYRGELESHRYSAAAKGLHGSQQASDWLCAVCEQARASVLDHCHEHGFVRGPVCASCNTRERPEFLYRNDVLVGSRYLDLFGTHAVDWLRHWHRCLGCRTRTILPLPHLAALTAHVAAGKLRPRHREPGSSRGRKPWLRSSVTTTAPQPAGPPPQKERGRVASPPRSTRPGRTR